MHPPSNSNNRAAVLAEFDSIADAVSGLMIDAGMTLTEMTELIRNRMVRNAADMLKREQGRINRSRLAALTGLPRADVSRILRHPGSASFSNKSNHPVLRVLHVWCNDSRFATKPGDPAPLPVFGKQGSFQKLVAISASGIPVRAMLDQLSSMRAVELLPGQIVKATPRKFTRAKAEASSMRSIGRKTRELIKSLRSDKDRGQEAEPASPPLAIVGRRKNLHRSVALK